jgi:hypothetical protein
VPIPILGPDIIDPRQMELIRMQAERAARGETYGVRELPAVALEVVVKQAEAAPGAAAAAAAPVVTDEAAEAERMRRRMEALARKRARDARLQQGS